MSTPSDPLIHLHAVEATADDEASATALPLDHEARRRSRQRLRLPDGREVAIVLPPGSTLPPGQFLHSADGLRFRVVAAAQPVLEVRAPDALTLLRAAYHLGNRHIPLQVDVEWLRLEPDPVLADLLQRLGCQVDAVERPFEPESGAYGGGHRHGHDATFADDMALAQAVFQRHATTPSDDPHAALATLPYRHGRPA
ncbi:MAG: urease accessory protein UreE [Lysobacteraceae bacterium]